MLINKTLKDKNRRLFFKKAELKFLFYKTILQTQQLPNEIYITAMLYLTKNRFMCRNFRNFCILTGRSHGIYSKFGISRFQLRQLGKLGLIPGLQKLSW